MLLENKVALVTGASRGIGASIANALGKKGAVVIGTATSEKGAHAITQTFKQEGIKGHGKVLDVKDGAQVDVLLSDIEEEVGAPLILVNNAGVTRDNLLLRMSDEEWNTVIHTNLTAIFQLTQKCLKAMMRKRWGRVINISSIVGSTGNPGQANYCAAKAGLAGLSKSLAYEIASRNITVNLVAPGFIRTDMTEALTDSQKEMILSKIPMKKMGEPDDIAQSVVFLASDHAQYITGQTLHVNGGMYMA